MSDQLLLCRDCGCFSKLALVLPGAGGGPPRAHPSRTSCPQCGSARILCHPELDRLAIAHVDCDAYYASIEKRDRPDLADQPVLVGGGERGVVLTCCYIARRFGVRSAMPMARALQLCPGAVVVRPRMDLYAAESRRMRVLFQQCADHVEQVSIDEAYLDLTGGPETHHTRPEPPARSLARLAWQIEKQIGITVSIGLAPNKMLAKLASDLAKPRGFSVIGRDDALDVIGPLPVAVLPGVGPVASARLAEQGIRKVADLRRANPDALVRGFGNWGRQLIRFAHADDPRPVRRSRRQAVTIGWRTFSSSWSGSASACPKGCAVTIWRRAG